jgi:hypothetical protein
MANKQSKVLFKIYYKSKWIGWDDKVVLAENAAEAIKMLDEYQLSHFKGMKVLEEQVDE